MELLGAGKRWKKDKGKCFLKKDSAGDQINFVMDFVTEKKNRRKFSGFKNGVGGIRTLAPFARPAAFRVRSLQPNLGTTPLWYVSIRLKLYVEMKALSTVF